MSAEQRAAELRAWDGILEEQYRPTRAHAEMLTKHRELRDMHATGRYPDWFKGKRFDKPTVGWACSVSGEVARDTVQRSLLGRSGAIGTGCIPKDAILETVTARGIAD